MTEIEKMTSKLRFNLHPGKQTDKKRNSVTVPIKKLNNTSMKHPGRESLIFQPVNQIDKNRNS